MTKLKEYSAIRDLLGAYLHQDWGLEYETIDDAVAAAIREADTQKLEAAISQMPSLIELIAFARTTWELMSLFMALGISYGPEDHGQTTKEWLEHVLDCMKRDLASRTS